MPAKIPLPRTEEEYERAAMAYQATLTMENLMEASPQASQRLITGHSFALLQALRPRFQFFNELLVQYPLGDEVGQVVPDNMVILTDHSERRRTSYATALEPAPVFWVLEYVSASNQRKDYVENHRKYELELRAPYYLNFHPDRQDLRLYHHDGESYVRMEPDLQGRMRIDELELEVGIWQGWVRYWYRGRLLEVPAEMEAQLQSMRRELGDANLKLQKRDQELQKRDKQLQNRDKQIQESLTFLRGQVEKRARKANREDIILLLTDATEAQLRQWLDELD